LWRDGDCGSDIRQNTTTQKVEFGPTVHLPLDQFQSMNLAFDLAVAPRQYNGGVHRLFVPTQSLTEMPNFW
jgi:hypothetical protein